MNEIVERVENNAGQVYDIVMPYSSSLANAIKNLFFAPSDKEVFLTVRTEAMKVRHEERMKLLDTAVELAKLDRLSENMFQLLMVAFAG